MKKLLLLFCLYISIATISYAQIYVDNQGNVYDTRKKIVNKSPEKKTYKKASPFDPSKLSFGGNFSLQFGNYTVIGISPQVGYNFSKYFTAGAGFGYTYFKDKHYDYKWNSSYLSFDIFGRFYPTDFLVMSIQPEISRMWQNVTYYDGEKVSENKFVPSLLIGGGVRFGGVMAMIQYDLVQDINSPYGTNLFYSVGYTFNF